jgi:hypothetical protein
MTGLLQGILTSKVSLVGVKIDCKGPIIYKEEQIRQVEERA